ncbi:E2-like enzyme [Orbilia blumenaviensis]|uniref:Autophagy-related protein 3 n=1 Tax=Orbilia blumenaviensis TaxID=1796055 RepID=A0AAV9U935_9PEZI
MAATVRSLFSDLRDRITPPTHTSTFLTTGKLTPEEFISAGDYLVYKFPTWSWSPAAPGKSKTYLPLDKQFLVTKGVPCHRRLDDNFAGSAGLNDRVVESGDVPGEGIDGDEEGWLSTGVTKNEEESASTAKDVRTVDDKGRVEENDDSESIGDMEDEEDDSEAIIRDGDNTKTPLRTYTLYITYSTYYSTPRLYLTGKHGSTSSPLTHAEMMQDIVGDYQDKTVTIEEFPFLEGNLKMPSVHPCKHASVMRLLLDRANAAAKAKKRREAEAESSSAGGGESREEREWEEIDYSKTLAEAKEEESDQQGKAEGKAGNPDDEAIRADQYLVVFLKFMASVTPGIEHDYTMGL